MQEKIKEYLSSIDVTWFHISAEKVAKDIAEICEKENTEAINKLYLRINERTDIIQELEKENELLKSKLINYNPTKQLELEEKINMLKAKCFRLRQTRMAYQSLADKRRDYANHISTTLHKKNLKIKELNQRVAELEANEVIYHKRLKDIKYLDEKELWHILWNSITKIPTNTAYGNMLDLVKGIQNAILSLAINRDKDRLCHKIKLILYAAKLRVENNYPTDTDEYAEAIYNELFTDEIIGKDK